MIKTVLPSSWCGPILNPKARFEGFVPNHHSGPTYPSYSAAYFDISYIPQYYKSAKSLSLLYMSVLGGCILANADSNTKEYLIYARAGIHYSVIYKFINDNYKSIIFAQNYDGSGLDLVLVGVV